MLEFREGHNNHIVFMHIDNLDERTMRGIRQGFFRLGNQLVRTLQQETLKKDKKGRVYRRRTRSGRSRKHVSSAPGQTPANMSGTYRKNAGYQLRGSSQLEFGIRDGASYAKYLESGTSAMLPRPGLANAIKSNERNARADFEGSIDRELNAK